MVIYLAIISFNTVDSKKTKIVRKIDFSEREAFGELAHFDVQVGLITDHV